MSQASQNTSQAIMPLHNRKKKVYKNDEVVRKWENKEEGRQINGAFVSVENIFLKTFLHILVFYTTENVFFFKLFKDPWQFTWQLKWDKQ